MNVHKNHRRETHGERMKPKKEAPKRESIEVMGSQSSSSGRGRQAGQRRPLGASSRQTRSRSTSIQVGRTYHLFLNERENERRVFSKRKTKTQKNRKEKDSIYTHCAFLRQTRCTCSPRPRGREGVPWDCPVLARRPPSHRYPRHRPLRILPRYLGTSCCPPQPRRPLARDCE